MTLSAAIILAAGEGTRMRSATPKVLHTLAGKTFLQRVMALKSSTRMTFPAPVARSNAP